MTRQPSDRDQVRREVEPALAAEYHVVKSRCFYVSPTHAATGIVALDHMIANPRWHQSETFELQF